MDTQKKCVHETEATHLNSDKDQLQVAIVYEHTLGLKDLPPVYSTCFTSLPSILAKAVKHPKQWLLVIRSGRKSCKSFQYYDNFYIEHSLRSWIGLAPLS